MDCKCLAPNLIVSFCVIPSHSQYPRTTLTQRGKQSGASKWQTSQRQAFANDITRPQLWAVTDNVNQSKSDRSPDAWKPPLRSFYCTYAKSWIQVKSHYDLTITSAEKSALSSMLDSC